MTNVHEQNDYRSVGYFLLEAACALSNAGSGGNGLMQYKSFASTCQLDLATLAETSCVDHIKAIYPGRKKAVLQNFLSPAYCRRHIDTSNLASFDQPARIVLL